MRRPSNEHHCNLPMYTLHSGRPSMNNPSVLSQAVRPLCSPRAKFSKARNSNLISDCRNYAVQFFSKKTLFDGRWVFGKTRWKVVRLVSSFSRNQCKISIPHLRKPFIKLCLESISEPHGLSLVRKSTTQFRQTKARFDFVEGKGNNSWFLKYRYFAKWPWLGEGTESRNVRFFYYQVTGNLAVWYW